MTNWGVCAERKIAQKWPKITKILRLEIENTSKSVKPLK